jgi:hypothetical protein
MPPTSYAAERANGLGGSREHVGWLGSATATTARGSLVTHIRPRGRLVVALGITSV